MKKYHPWQTNDLDCMKSGRVDRFEILDNNSVLKMMGVVVDLLGAGYSVNLRNEKQSNTIWVDSFKWNEFEPEEI